MEFRLDVQDVELIAKRVAAILLNESQPQPEPETDDLIDVFALMKYLDMSERWVRLQVEEFKLPFYSFGRRIKFKKSEIDAHLRKCAVLPVHYPGRG
jgi:excisionase family DNA binding protein